MKREELLNILTQDGTLDEIKKAVLDQELTEKEQENILSFLETRDEKYAELCFSEILQNIGSIHAFDTGKEEKLGWKEYRVEIAQQIKQLKNEELNFDKQYDKLMSEIDRAKRVSPEAGAAVEKALKPLIDENREQLSIKTKQHSALALMHTHAKTAERQAASREFLEATQPFRDTLKHSWQTLSSQTIGFSQATKSYFQTGMLNIHPVSDLINSSRVRSAKDEMEKINDTKKKIQESEKKLLEKANKISKKEFRKNNILNDIKSFAKGERPVDKYVEIKDVEKAKAILADSKSLQGKYIQHNIDKLKKEVAHSEQKIEKLMNKVDQSLTKRREKIQTISSDVYHKMENGTYAGRSGAGIRNNLGKGLDSTYVSKDSLSADLRAYMEKNHAHLIDGPDTEMAVVKYPSAATAPELATDKTATAPELATDKTATAPELATDKTATAPELATDKTATAPELATEQDIFVQELEANQEAQDINLDEIVNKLDEIVNKYPSGHDVAGQDEINLDEIGRPVVDQSFDIEGQEIENPDLDDIEIERR